MLKDEPKAKRSRLKLGCLRKDDRGRQRDAGVCALVDDDPAESVSTYKISALETQKGEGV